MPDSRPTVENEPHPDLSNRQLGNYQVIRRLGRGGMADVYLAEQTSLRRQVAIKVLHRNLGKDASYVRRFHNEAQAAAALVHANIVQIHEVGCIDGVHFIVQEFVDGLNLKQYVSRRGPLDARQAVLVMRQVAAALHRAGQRGIVHRDIKPENIMLTSTGEVKVADFGLARLTNDVARVDLTQVGMTMGTPLYMSPEQVEGRELDSRSDLYSFGITCYEMLAGRPPFEADHPIAVAVHHLKTEPVRLDTLRKDLPGSLCRIIHRLMAKKPEDRYSSAAEVLRDLRMVVVEGGEDWSLADEDGINVSWETDVVNRLAATQQLATVMEREARLPSLWRPGLVSLMLLLVAVAAGSTVAWLNRPASLLVSREGVLADVPVKDSVEEQYTWAVFYGRTERAFKAVEENFPPEPSQPLNVEYARKARLQLAYLYDDNRRTTEAIELLSQLAAEESSKQIQTRAIARLANIRERNGETGLADENVRELAKVIAGSGQVDESLRNDVMDELESRRLQRQLEEHLASLTSQATRPANSPGPVSGGKSGS